MKTSGINSCTPILRPGLLLLLTIGIVAGSVFTWQAGRIAVKAHLSQWLLQNAWERSLASGMPLQPWSNFDSFPVARLYTDKQSHESIVLAGNSGQALAFGPTMILPSTEKAVSLANTVINSPMASGKRNNNQGTGLIAIAGHRDTHLSFLEHTDTGQQIGIETINGIKRLYTVVEKKIVNTQHEQLMIDPAQPGLLLVTCYPFNATVPGGPLRLLVYASPLERDRGYIIDSPEPKTEHRIQAHKTTVKQPTGML